MITNTYIDHEFFPDSECPQKLILDYFKACLANNKEKIEEHASVLVSGQLRSIDNYTLGWKK